MSRIAEPLARLSVRARATVFCLVLTLIATTTMTARAVEMGGFDINATGATTKWDGSSLVLIYTNPANYTLTLPSYADAWVLSGGGGGAGANPGDAANSKGGAGGGGAGGFVENKSLRLKNGIYEITVGAGGTSPDAQGAGGNGEDTSFTLGGENVVDVAIGGGGGGIMATKGGDGGSGGGGSNGGKPGSGTSGQGNDGGEAKVNRSGGGGGGAGGIGGDAVSITQAGEGGLGRYSSITGDEIMYAAGGGGGSRAGTGGIGGTNSVGIAIGGSGAGGSIGAKSGTAGTGSGGGGGSYNFQRGGAGGSGTVIVRLNRIMPLIPTNAVYSYTGAEITAYTADENACTVTGETSGTEVRDYEYTVTLKSGAVWSDGSSSPHSKTVTWSIYRPHIVIESFTMEDWVLGGAQKTPVITATVNGDSVAQSALNVSYMYSTASTGPWTSSVPNSSGVWYVRADIDDTGKVYSAPVEAPVTWFKVWANIDGSWTNRLGCATGGNNVRYVANGDGTYDVVHIFTSNGTLLVPENISAVAGSVRLHIVGSASVTLSGTKYTADAEGLTLSPGTAAVTATTSAPAEIRYTVLPNGTKINGAEIWFVGATATNWYDGDLIITYADTNTNTVGELVLPNYTKAWVLAVGGGGAGANPGDALNNKGGAGGGGAGGFVETNGVLLANGTYSITVGAGGTSPNTQGAGGKGGDTKFTLGGANAVDVAIGGGGGGIMATKGGDGGSGGGGSNGGGPGSGTSGQGNSGGVATVNRSGGGGGGAGGIGGSPASNALGGAGGLGRYSSITGDEVMYAAGGGGGSRTGTGGVGGTNSVGTVIGGSGAGASVEAKTGAAGTGSGGGGGSYNFKQGGAGGSGILIIRISPDGVMPVKPEQPVPSEFPYDGEEHVMVEPSAAYTIDGDAAGTAVNNYTYTVRLKEGFCWADGSDGDAGPFDWKITKATIAVKVFSQRGWQIGEERPAPVLTATNTVTGAEVTLAESGVTYTYSSSPSGGFTTIVPSTAGTWYMRAAVAESANNTGFTTDVISFDLWEASATPGAYSGILAFHADFTVDGYDAPPRTTLENFPMLVRVSEDSPYGFSYATADPATIRFVDEWGTSLPFRRESWNPGGESRFWVIIPEYRRGAKVTMCWGLVADAELPPEDEWTDPTGTSEDWQYAEGIQEGDPDPNPPSSNAIYDGSSKVENFWIVEPTGSPTAWSTGEEVNVPDLGTPAYGAGTAFYIMSTISGEIVSETNSTKVASAGTYWLNIVVPEGRTSGNFSWKSLSYHVVVIVSAHSPISDLGGLTGSSTLSGRVLLANDDDNPAAPVSGQGYYLDNPGVGDAYWVHDEEGKSSVSKAFPNLEEHVSHTLVSSAPIAELCGETNIWRLVDVRIGNTYTSVAEISNPDKAKNFLPYSETSKPFTAPSEQHGVPKESAHLVMRNTTGAVIYSPCYTNGIGTIYFDAVNGWNTNAWKTTALTSEALANYHQIVVEVVRGVTTNIADIAESDWEKVNVVSLKRDGTESFVHDGTTNTLGLCIGNGGTLDNFYRLVVPFDGVTNGECREPVRFRIRRVTSVPTDTFKIDEAAFILIDNLIVSYPAMRADLRSAGRFDESKTGRSVLGEECAFSVPYPAAGQSGVTPRALASFTTNALAQANIDEFITAANIHYRWRYLEQKTNDAWKVASLDPKTITAEVPLLGSADAMDLTSDDGRARQGDIEFWFDATLNAPYYRYVDYSGSGLGVEWTDASDARHAYSEEILSVTNAASGRVYASRGTDWFVRLRPGRSSYAALDVVYKRAGSSDVKRERMVLDGDGLWRGFVQTREDQTGRFMYRIEALDFCEEPYAEYTATTNYWSCKTDDPLFPVSDSLEEGTAESWSKITLDAVTGHVMFQVEDRTNPKAITIVHADYQNFNGWTDAHDRKASDGNGPIFVGTSTTNEYKVGVSPSKQTFREAFSDWQTMPATNEYWVVPRFDGEHDDINHLYGRTAYETFSSDTNGLWAIGQGMWVSKRYRQDANKSGVAIQMEGNGKGYLQFSDTAAAPRGLESVSFNARLGQFVKFDDFAYYYATPIMNMSNYTFVTRAAFDLNANKDFSGNASLSMVAYYLPSKGAYEVRWEWLGTNSNANRGQRLCLYKWTVLPSGVKKSELIIARTNNDFNVEAPTALANGATQRFAPLFISVTNDVANNCTWVVAGVRRCGVKLGDSPIGTTAANSADGRNANWFGVAFRDSTDTRLTRGTYGVLSANCPGYFARPEFSHTIQMPPSAANPTAANPKTSFANEALSEAAALKDVKNCAADDLRDEEYPGWNIIPGRLKTTYTDMAVNAIYSAPVAQELKIFLGTPGRSDWGEAVTNIALTSFGSPTKPFTLPLYTTKDCSVRFEVDGTIEDVRTDIVIDSVVLKQWRGGNWNTDGEINGVSKYLPAWASPSERSKVDAHTNFVFTSAWIKDNAVLLSAKRTEIDTPSSIRTPLMDDGGINRGLGLGMVSVEYANADENTWLWLQIATNNVSYSTVDSSDHKFDESIWTTVTNYNFAVEPLKSHLSRGTLNTYLGLHSVTGVARIVVATNAVAKVANVTDTKKFGEVTITKITCSDEPPVDIHSWWGWNMRTEGDDMDSKKRMYLADFPGSTGDTGLSLALNESVSATYSKSEIDVSDRESYLPHNPFLQTPTFTSNVVGEVVFKARKFSDHSEPAAVVLLGSMDASDKDEGTWSRLDGGIFYVTNTYYETYSYKTDPGRNYTAFRLAVMGVEDVREKESGGGSGLPPGVDEPHRVLIDEMYVSEAVRTRMGFRHVGCFRGDPSLGTSLSSTTEVPGVPSRKMQPLCGESWGVQCEVYGAQLAGDIDFAGHQPRVKLHWYAGNTPWGYEKWKDDPSAGSAWLSRATGTDEDRYVYRSSMKDSPAAVMSMSTMAPTYVQYMLEVEYYTVGSTKPVTNWMSAADWVVPEWYRPLDLNAEYGGGKNFAAYNILDNVAPDWAWINEVNVFGEFPRYRNTDADCQYIEIAHPPEADISGWTVRLLEPRPGDNMVVTNVLVRFGDPGLPGTKQIASEDAAANMVFRVIANKATRQSGKVEARGGKVEAVWKVDNPTLVFTEDGEISAYDPVAIQLVRSSRIVEHEIMIEGTNFLESLDIEAPDYLYQMRDWTTNRMVKSSMILPGYDMGGLDNSLSVTQNFGRCGMEQPTNDWTNGAVMTPGHVNDGQFIDPNHPMPAGEELLVYFTVSGDHIEQSFDGVNFTNGMFSVVVGKNSTTGTNVIYRTDPWYVLASATTNAGSRRVSIMDLVSGRSAKQPYVYTLSGVAKGIANNVTVMASAELDPRIAGDWGVPEDDPYHDAIVDWLRGGVDLYGNPFKDVESGEVRLAKFRSMNGTVVTNLTLREMYWLDMDPTAGQLSLTGGMKMKDGDPTHEMVWHFDDGTSLTLTNTLVDAYLMISNEDATATQPDGWVQRGPNDRYTHWTPYVLRGLVPGENSQGYTSARDAWGSVSFKVTGTILNGYTSPTVEDNRVPLRQFVFDEDSFGADGWSHVEVRDPHSPLSYGYNSGWKRVWEKDAAEGRNPSEVFYFWSIDTRLPQMGTEMLNRENYYGE